MSGKPEAKSTYRVLSVQSVQHARNQWTTTDVITPAASVDQASAIALSLLNLNHYNVSIEITTVVHIPQSMVSKWTNQPG